MGNVLLQMITDLVIKLDFMKGVKIITNPYTVIITFLMIIISGQHLGGFYIVYLLLALPHGGIHALFAIIGISLLLIIYHSKTRFSIIKSAINVIAVLMLIVSIFIFFYTDDEHYNYGTFYQLVPQITLILFAFIALCFLVRNIVSFFRSPSTTH